jgi:hypothetical protein
VFTYTQNHHGEAAKHPAHATIAELHLDEPGQYLVQANVGIRNRGPGGTRAWVGLCGRGGEPLDVMEQSLADPRRGMSAIVIPLSEPLEIDAPTIFTVRASAQGAPVDVTVQLLSAREVELVAP